MRRALVLLAGVALLATAAPSQAAPQAAPQAGGPRLQRQLLVLSYDGVGPALVSVRGRVEAKGHPGYLATVSAEEEDGRLVPFFPNVVELGADGRPAHTYGAPGSHDLCASPVVTCKADPKSGAVEFGITFVIDQGPRPAHLRMLIAAEGTRVSTSHVQLGGWKARRSGAAFSRVTGGGTGISAQGTALEALPAATLRGGRNGSIAIAVPPCEQLGVGSVTLTGGPSARSADCPTAPYAGAAPGGTTWSLGGTAAGLTSYLTRLLVIDL